MSSLRKKTSGMLAYVKTVLEAVSFDIILFEKELRKGIQALVLEEIDQLKKWCYETFDKQHQPILARCFV